MFLRAAYSVYRRLQEESDEPVVHVKEPWIESGAVIGISFAFAFVAIALSFHLIFLHLKHYNRPILQRNIIRIIMIVPIYALCSFLSLCFHEYGPYISAVRDIYESICIHCFLALMLDFPGGEDAVIQGIKEKPPMNHPWPMKYCLPRIRLGVDFIIHMKQTTLQFIILKPLMAFLTIISLAADKYDTDAVQYFILIVYNISYTVALYGLALFYMASKDLLVGFSPIAKFGAVKIIVFATYYQSLAVMAIPGADTMGSSERWNDFIICIEMALFAIMHEFCFTYKEFLPGGVGVSNLAAMGYDEPVNIRQDTTAKAALLRASDVFQLEDVLSDIRRNFRVGASTYIMQGIDGGIQHEGSADVIMSRNSGGGSTNEFNEFSMVGASDLTKGASQVHADPTNVNRNMKGGTSSGLISNPLASTLPQGQGQPQEQDRSNDVSLYIDGAAPLSVEEVKNSIAAGPRTTAVPSGNAQRLPASGNGSLVSVSRQDRLKNRGTSNNSGNGSAGALSGKGSVEDVATATAALAATVLGSTTGAVKAPSGETSQSSKNIENVDDWTAEFISSSVPPGNVNSTVSAAFEASPVVTNAENTPKFDEAGFAVSSDAASAFAVAEGEFDAFNESGPLPDNVIRSDVHGESTNSPQGIENMNSIDTHTINDSMNQQNHFSDEPPPLPPRTPKRPSVLSVDVTHPTFVAPSAASADVEAAVTPVASTDVEMNRAEELSSASFSVPPVEDPSSDVIETQQEVVNSPEGLFSPPLPPAPPSPSTYLRKEEEELEDTAKEISFGEESRNSEDSAEFHNIHDSSPGGPQNDFDGFAYGVDAFQDNFDSFAPASEGFIEGGLVEDDMLGYDGEGVDFGDSNVDFDGFDGEVEEVADEIEWQAAQRVQNEEKPSGKGEFDEFL